MTKNPSVPYEAVELADQTPVSAFLVEAYSDGRYCAFAYTTLYSVMLESEFGGRTPVVNIRTRSAQIRLHGKNLHQLIPAFSSNSCKRITEFNPSIHLPPPKTAVILERIEVFTHSHY